MRRTIFLLSFVTFVFLIQIAGAAEPFPLRVQAVTSYREGRYEEAAKLYREILIKDPKNVDLLRDLMWVLWKSERFQESSEVATLVLELRKDDAEAKGIIEKAPTLALRAEANANYHAGHYEQANKLYRQLAVQDPTNTAVLRDLMWSLWETESYDEARAVAAQILTIRKDDKEAQDMMKRAPMAALRSKAVRNYRAGNYEDAIKSYRELLIQSPKNQSLLKDLYWALWQTGHFEKVEIVARQLSDLYPADADAWNMLGRAYVANSKQEEALTAYQKSLAINPKQPDSRRAVARLLVDLREFDSALEILGDLEKNDPNTPSIYPQMAKAQYFKGLYAESAINWAKAVQMYPENDNYRIHEARALYYAGQNPLAISKLKKIAYGSGPMKGLALDFLVDDALSNHDYSGAEKILSENLIDVQPIDEPRLLKLATIYFEDKKLTLCFQVLNRYLKLYPTNSPALLLKADILYDNGMSSEAAKIYKRVQALNPYSIRANDGLANAELAMGHPKRALKAFMAALRLDPTDPYLIILQSHYLDVSGRQKQSQNILLKWLKKNKGPVLPVLLYHGLTPFKRDPLLAYPVHMQVAVFEDQMRAIKEAGYTPVTSDQVVAWYKKNTPLPDKPILITFDDGRLDSFRYADPILKKYGLRGTMFAPIANIEGNLPPGYVSWDQMRDYQNSGRWDIQAHGDMGHSRIVIDSDGRKGLFLVNKQWLDKENRLETMAEWKARITEDHDSEKRKITKRLGKTPLSYAYPEGTYGQIDITNSAEAVPINLEVSGKEYQAFYHQDRFGLNVHTRDPMYLTRLEPHPDWTGEELVRYLQDNDPSVLMNRRLLWQATWEGRARKATGFLNNLKAVGASQVVLLGEEGRIRSSLGEFEGGRAAAENALQIGKDKETKALLHSIKIEERPSWSPGYTFTEDNRHRRNSIFEQTIHPFPVSKINVGILYLYGTFKELNISDVTENGAGLSVQGNLSTFHSLGGRAMWHWFPTRTQIDDTYSGSVYLDSNWTDNVKTEFKVGRSLYDTARALRANVTENYVNAYGFWRPEGPWRASTKIQGAKLSDGNRRYGTELSLSRTLISELRGVYKFTFDHMDDISSNYYSPQQLHQHQLGLEYTPTSRWFQPSISFLPGVGKERGTRSEYIQDLQASLLFRLGMRTTIQPSYSQLRTPTYRRNTYNLMLTQRF